MILVHRLKGEPFVVNADLIESVEAHPDTILRLVDGRKAVVAETPDEIIALVVAFRGAIVRAADELRDDAGERRARPRGEAGDASRPKLTVLPSDQGGAP